MSTKMIKEIFEDATTLEVNSILVDGITGCKIPSVSIAFYETVHAWVENFSTLLRSLERMQIEFNPNPPEMIAAVTIWIKDGDELLSQYGIKEVSFQLFSEDSRLIKVLNTDDFVIFRKAVNPLLAGRNKGVALMAEISRFLKIQSRLNKLRLRFTETLSATRSSEEENQMADRNRNELRKLWELKDGYIFAQNVVQLDGDIITRYNLRLYRDPRVNEKATQLLDFHKGNVEAGMKHWHFIIETIVSIAKAITSKIF